MKEFIFDNVWSSLQIWFLVNKVFYFSNPCPKETIFRSGLQTVHLDSLCNAGAPAWQAEQLLRFNRRWTAVVSLRRQGLWKAPVMLLTAHKLLWLILPLSFSPPFFFFSETELSVTAELVPTSSWNISSELDKGIQWAHTGEVEEGRRTITSRKERYFYIFFSAIYLQKSKYIDANLKTMF